MTFKLKSLDELSMQRVLGKGTFGEVREATHLPSGRRVAIKSIEKAKLNRKRRDRVQQEVDILSSLNHDGICRLYQAVQDERFVLLVMEHLNGGDLFDLVQQRGPLDETREVRPLFRQLCEAVQHCHARGIVHHDIKLENCMLSLGPNEAGAAPPVVHNTEEHGDTAPAGDDDDEDEASMELQSQHATDEVDDNDRGEETDDDDEEEDGRGSTVKKHRRQRTQLVLLPAEARVKLIDFGLACRVERPGQLLATFSGTEQYAAPEVLEGRAYDGFKTDAYSLGVVLYLLLTAAYPFSPDDVDLQLDEQTSPAFLASLPFPAHVSADARDLVCGLLRTDPRRRLTVAAALRHPFFLSHSATVVDARQAEGPNPDELRAAAALASLDYACDNMSLGY